MLREVVNACCRYNFIRLLHVRRGQFVLHRAELGLPSEPPVGSTTATTSAWSTPTDPGNGVSTLSPTHPDMGDNCNEFYLVEPGTPCGDVVATNGISLVELNELVRRSRPVFAPCQRPTLSPGNLVDRPTPPFFLSIEKELGGTNSPPRTPTSVAPARVSGRTPTSAWVSLGARRRWPRRRLMAARGPRPRLFRQV